MENRKKSKNAAATKKQDARNKLKKMKASESEPSDAEPSPKKKKITKKPVKKRKFYPLLGQIGIEKFIFWGTYPWLHFLTIFSISFPIFQIMYN